MSYIFIASTDLILFIFFFTFSGTPKENEIQFDEEPLWDREDEIIRGLTCIAVVGIEDPVRNEVGILVYSFYF